MPDWLNVLILGVIEGLTEFIPVSSTGHLLLTEHFLGLAPGSLLRSDLFNVIIQTSAVLAVLPLFKSRLRSFVNWSDVEGRAYVAKIVVAFGITGAFGLVLEKLDFKLPDKPVPIAAALVAGGVAFLVVERWLRGRTFRDELTWTVVGAVGLGQLLAIIFPGASRSGTTILLSLLLGLSRPAATEFSFLVSIPTMTAAGGLKLLKQLHEAGGLTQSEWGLVVFGTVVSAVVSFTVVRWFLRFVQQHTFEGFGYYRIAFGVAMLLLLSR